MGKPYPILQDRNQLCLPVFEDFEKLQGEKLMASYISCVNPRSPGQQKRYAATFTSSRFVGNSPKQDVLRKSPENSCLPRKMLPGLESQTVRAGDDMQPDAQTVAITMGKKEEVPPVIKQPCPPSTCREQGRHAVIAFRRRKFRGECHGSTSSEGINTRKHQGYKENCSGPKTIMTIDNFTVDFPGTESRRPTDHEGECDKTLQTPPVKDCYEEEKNGNKERNNGNFSDYVPDVSKGATFARTKRLTDRNQVEYFVDLDCKMSRHVCKVTDFCQLNKEKPKLGLNPLDTFAQRQLRCNVKFCRENLELADKVTPKTCKDVDTTKEMMINNWLIDVSKVR